MAAVSRRVALGVLGALGASEGMAQPAAAPPTVRLRGRVADFDGEVLTVAAREGGQVPVRLTEASVVASLRRVTPAELVPGTNLGVVAEPAGDGLRAVAVTVLPATATRQFQSEWDLSAGSTMNNGAVAGVVSRAEGHDLTLTINGREVPVRVDGATAIVRPAEASRADLVAGRAVFVTATRGADGALTAVRVTVERDGVAPPT